MDNHPPPDKVATIIVSRPGVIRQALQTMLALLPQIEITGAAGGGLSALNLARQNRPALLIIDSSLPEDEIQALLQQIKQEQPQIRCLVLAETSRQQAAVLALGADAAILRSEPTERLVEALNNMGLW
jgi:DNA-binding NarL/FixJ family response regulator